MGKLEIKGSAERTMDYDLMKLSLDFHSREKTAAEASKNVMQECEEFLGILKKGGLDISEIALSRDSVNKEQYYDGNRGVECYMANRAIEITAKFDMKLINTIRAICNSAESQVSFRVNYALSNENDIKEELLREALKDAKRQAELMAEAVGLKVVGLLSADKNDPMRGMEQSSDAGIYCLAQLSLDEYDEYENSDELSASDTKLSETIYTSWEIA